MRKRESSSHPLVKEKYENGIVNKSAFGTALQPPQPEALCGLYAMKPGQRICFCFLVLVLKGCASPESLQREFWSLLQEENSCVEDSHCVLIDTDCWLPCEDAAVNREKVSKLEQLERRYMESSKFLDGNTCIAVSACRANKAAQCISGQCQVVYSDQTF